jgi:hypothetical protein
MSDEARHWLGLLQYNPSTRKNKTEGGKVHVVLTTEYKELQPLLSGAHSVKRVKLAVAGEGGGGARPLLFITFTITSKIAVYAPAEWADTLTLFHL